MIFQLIIVKYLQSINSYQIGDTLFNWAKSGLNLREEMKLDSERKLKIKYGEIVIVLQSKDELYPENEKLTSVYEIWGKKQKNVEYYGKWVKVNYKGTIGYVFDGFLSRLKPPNEGKKELYLNDPVKSGLKEYLKEEIGIVKYSKKLPESNVGTEKIMYNYGIYLNNYTDESTSGFRLIIPETTFEEAFQLIYNLNDVIITSIEQEKERCKINLGCGGYLIRMIDNVCIIDGGFGC